jgi:hypothetical protein
MNPKKTAVLVGFTSVLAIILFWLVYRPWARTWGATDKEIDRRMPGDEIVEGPIFDATRAVTIAASRDEIWPWIVQMGYLRAGFYSWDQLDNDGIPSAERIIPELQNLRVGDLVPLSHDATAKVEILEPARHLLLVFRGDPEATWAWGLYATTADKTRLVTRLRVGTGGLRSRLVLDAFEIIMMRKCLLGIKRRAESLS